jgi:hypothetical protein
MGTRTVILPRKKIYTDIPALREALLHEFHSTPIGGHFGVKPSLARISASFYWPGLLKDFISFIKKCSECQHNKYVPAKKQGLLQPVSIP